jgi:hypothetical protein
VKILEDTGQPLPDLCSRVQGQSLSCQPGLLCPVLTSSETEILRCNTVTVWLPPLLPPAQSGYCRRPA